MALDVGDRRIGIALSDALKIIANPYETYVRKGNETDFEYFKKLVNDKEVCLIICGLPISMSGGENAQTQKTRDFISQLQSAIDTEIKFVDERLTTWSAEQVLIEGNMRREERKNVIDKVAAAIILQHYLDYYKK